MLQRLLPLLGLAALTLFPGSARADDPAPGFNATDLPGGGPFITTLLSSGDFVGVGSFTLARFAADGTLLQTLHTFSNPIAPESIAVDPTESFVVVGRSNGYLGGTYRVDLAGGPATQLSFLTGSYMAFESDDQVLLTVTDAFFGWWLYRMDVNTGAFTQKTPTYGSVLSPLTLDAAGNLYLVHFDAASSGYEIERFSAAQLAAPGMFAVGDGTIVQQGGADVVGDIAVTPDGSTLFVAESPSFVLDTILAAPVGGGPGTQLLQLTGAGEDIFQLQLLPATAPAQFLAYQPAIAGELVYQTRQSGTKRRKSLTPARPSATLSGPGTTGSGSFDLTLTGGPPGGSASLYLGPLSLYNPSEPALFPRSIPLFFGLDLETLRRLEGGLPLDASGNGVRQLFNESGATGVWAIQAVLFDAGGVLVGTATAAFL